MELEKLKAHAYDCLAQVEAWQAKLKKANEAILELGAKVVEPEITKEPKED